MNTSDWSLMGALKQAWSLTKENLIVVWGLLFLIWLGAFVLGLLSGESYSIRYWIFWLVQMLVTAWLNGSLYKILLNMTDGEEASFSVFKEMIPHIGKLFLVTIVTSLLIYSPLFVTTLMQGLFADVDWSLLGDTDINSFTAFVSMLFSGYWGLLWCIAVLLMCYLAVRLLFASYALVDHLELGAMAALRRSWQMTQGNEGKLILAFLLVIAINVIGLCALIVGVFVSIVTTTFYLAVLYRQIDKAQNEVEVPVADEE